MRVIPVSSLDGGEISQRIWKTFHTMQDSVDRDLNASNISPKGFVEARATANVLEDMRVQIHGAKLVAGKFDGLVNSWLGKRDALSKAMLAFDQGTTAYAMLRGMREAYNIMGCSLDSIICELLNEALATR